MSKKKALVTGGAGFLGSHLTGKLIGKNYQVICLDNFLTGSKENISHLLEHPDFSLVDHDVCNPFDFQVDEIYNLACPASPVHYQSNPIYTTKINALGAINILELAKKSNAKTFQASTSEVYGDPHVHPQKEDYFGNVNPIGVRSCYDEGKRIAETLFFDYYRQHNVPIKVARIFNTYGPRMDPQDGRVVSNFIVQALLEKPITIYGSGMQTRSFCFVDDLIEAFILFMDHPEIGPINLGNPSEFKVIELAKMVIDLTGSKSKIIYKPLPSDDPKQRQPNIEKAKALLKWVPKISLKEGLNQTIAYFDSLLKENSLIV